MMRWKDYLLMYGVLITIIIGFSIALHAKEWIALVV